MMTDSSSDTAPPLNVVEASPLALVKLVLHYRRWVVTIPLVLCVLFGVRALLSERSYTTSLEFTPQAQSSPAGGFAGLAAQLGINVAGGAGGESPDFYIDLVRSYNFLRDLATTRYVAARGGTRVEGNIAQLYQIDLGDSARTVDAATRLVAALTNASVDPKSQVIKMNITTFDPDLSVAIGRHIVEQVNAFNSHTRQTQAAAERTFIEGRMHEAEGELRGAEDDALQFMQRNRDFRNSPQLSFENDRLQRELLRRQGVVNSLAQAFEQARIDEVRNTPVITVVQDPARPAQADSRRVVLKVIVAGVVGFLLAIMLAAATETWRRLVAEEPETSADIARTVVSLRNEARHPLQTLRKWFGRTQR